MREWGKTMGCEGANIKMISDGNTEVSKVSIGSVDHAQTPSKSSANACYNCMSSIAVIVSS